MTIELTELDLDLLELGAVQVPWYMVCGEFHARYGSPRALVWRLLELRQANLLEIRVRGDTPATLEALEADAIANDCYEDIEMVLEPRWDIVATDLGFERVEHRLAAQ